MPTNHDETLQQRYEREHRDFERIEAQHAEHEIQHLPADDTEGDVK